MEKIIDYLKALNHSASLAELKDFCNVQSGEDVTNLIKQLNHLVTNGQLIEIDGQYDLLEREGRAKGTIVIKRNFRAYIYEGDDVYEVINAKNFNLLNHDEVLYEKRPAGVFVVAVLKHNIVYVVGLIRIRNNKVIFLPDDPSFPKGFKIVNLKQFPIQDKVKVRLFVSDYQKKELKIERIIGKLYSPRVQELSLLYTYDIPMEFNQTAINEAQALDQIIKLEDYPERKDLSGELVITIDGDDAKDFDDAISLELSNDNYLLKVHIADVSHYVINKSALDKEAYKRGTSIYYPNHVIPMLPFELSNDLCSLRPNEKRLALTVEMEFNKQADLIRYDFYESVIESKYRMTYSNVNKILAGDEKLSQKYAALVPMLHQANELSNALKEKRKLSGGIEFDTDESSFKIVNDEVIDIYPRVRGISEGIIEDFMIAANVCVADHMHYLDYPMVYRNHDLPKEERLEAFVNFVEQLGYHFKGNKKAIHAKQLADCLASFKDEAQYPVVAAYCLRSMAKAKYDNISGGHYGLGLENYCHFTSPIRRYPDLMVHRMLKKYVISQNPDFKQLDKDSENNAKVAIKCSERERVAIELERDLEDFYKCQYIQKHVGEIYEAVISSTTSFGFYVKLDNTVEGLVHIKTLEGFFELQNDGSLSNGETSYRLGDIVKVKCQDVDLLRNNIDFVLYKKHRQRWI